MQYVSECHSSGAGVYARNYSTHREVGSRLTELGSCIWETVLAPAKLVPTPKIFGTHIREAFLILASLVLTQLLRQKSMSCSNEVSSRSKGVNPPSKNSFFICLDKFVFKGHVQKVIISYI